MYKKVESYVVMANRQILSSSSSMPLPPSLSSSSLSTSQLSNLSTYNLVRYFRRSNYGENLLLENYGWLYEQLLLRYSDSKKYTFENLNLFNVSYSLLVQLRRVFQEMKKRKLIDKGEDKNNLEVWLKLNDSMYNAWLASIDSAGVSSGVNVPANDSFANSATSNMKFFAANKDPSTFPRDSILHRDWKVLSEAVQVVEKRLTGLENDRRNALLDCREMTLRMNQLKKLNFVQDRLTDTFEKLHNSAPASGLPVGSGT